MRVSLSVLAGVALAFVGSLAIAGSGYTPPPSAGGGVSGDGSGVTDASAFRSALSLGTAATTNTGTSSGTVPVLGMGGALPAVDGSNLTGLLSTQISGLGTASGYSATAFLQATNNLSDVTPITARSNLGLGTAATLDTGTTANKVVQLTAEAKLPAVDGSLLTNLSGGSIALDVQAFTSSGTWTKPDGKSMVQVIAIGAGGGGGEQRAAAAQLHPQDRQRQRQGRGIGQRHRRQPGQHAVGEPEHDARHEQQQHREAEVARAAAAQGPHRLRQEGRGGQRAGDDAEDLDGVHGAAPLSRRRGRPYASPHGTCPSAFRDLARR